MPGDELLSGVQHLSRGAQQRAGLAHQAVYVAGHRAGAALHTGAGDRRPHAASESQDRERRRSEHDGGSHHLSVVRGLSPHLAVVPRCSKKLTSPGAAPITSAAAAETKAAIRPRAA